MLTRREEEELVLARCKRAEELALARHKEKEQFKEVRLKEEMQRSHQQQQLAVARH